MLTPSLALTSLAGATPSNWRVRYHDENLLHGPPPHRPFPQVVGITETALKVRAFHAYESIRTALRELEADSTKERSR